MTRAANDVSHVPIIKGIPGKSIISINGWLLRIFGVSVMCVCVCVSETLSSYQRGRGGVLYSRTGN